METSELTFRQAQLLGYIVKEHIRTAAPVASRLLIDYYNLDVSPATVRNAMAALESTGYVYHPHTSAGRIPTPRGYRLFVDTLLTVKPLARGEVRQIEAQWGIDEINRQKAFRRLILLKPKMAYRARRERGRRLARRSLKAAVAPRVVPFGDIRFLRRPRSRSRSAR